MSGERKMSERFTESFFSMREKVKAQSKIMGEKMSEKMGEVSAKVKDLMKSQTIAEKLVEEATSENVADPDWGRSLAICDMVNEKKATGAEVVGAIKRRLEVDNSVVQGHALTLLEMVAKNCEGVFADIARGQVLDQVVRVGEDRSNPQNSKALIMIESWGEAREELQNLPIFAETYNSMKSRGIVFPGRDNESLAPIFTPPQSVAPVPRQAAQEAPPVISDEERLAKTREVFDVARNSIELLNTVLTSAPEKEALKDEVTSSLVAQCRRSQHQVMMIIQTSEDNESIMFEALNVNDELQKTLDKFDELAGTNQEAELKAAMDASRQQQTTSTPPVGAPPVVAPPGQAGPGPHMYADILGDDDDDSALDSKAEALVRRSGLKSAESKPTAEDPMADLDELVFGKKQEGSIEAAGSKEEKKAPL